MCERAGAERGRGKWVGRRGVREGGCEGGRGKWVIGGGGDVAVLIFAGGRRRKGGRGGMGEVAVLIFAGG